MEDRLTHAIAFINRNPHPPGRKRNQAVGVYLWECQGMHKIGIACNAKHRLQVAQVSCPWPINQLMFRIVRRPSRYERRLHRAFQRYRVRGEWFKLPPEVLFRLLSKP